MRQINLLRCLERLPILGLLGLLWVPLGLSCAHLGGLQGRNFLQRLNAPSLQGMRSPRVIVTPQTLQTGEFQKQVEGWLSANLPIRNRVIRAMNQLYYSAFQKSYMYNGTIWVGQQNYLYESWYVEKYCNLKGNAATVDDFQQWRQELEKVQDFFERRGQKFMLLITPSKAAYYPEYLPSGVPCPAAALRLDYHRAIQVLQRSRIPYVDGSQITLAQKGRVPIEIFQQAGTHWNTWGGALAAQALVQRMRQVTGRSLPDLEFTYTIDYIPTLVDVDLLDLLNLAQPDRTFAVSKIHQKSLPRQPLKVAWVGGSFVDQVNEAFVQSGLFCQIDKYYYMTIDHAQFPEQGGCGYPEAEGGYGNILLADIVILEENESKLRSPQFQLLQKFLFEANRP